MKSYLNFFGNSLINLIALTILIMGATGCTLTSLTFTPYNFKEDLHMKKFRPRIDALIIILDASISMTESYLGREKFQTAIMALHHVNESLSAIRIQTGFKVLGTGTCHFCEKYRQLFKLKPYDPKLLHINNLKKINPGGESPLDIAILSVKDDIQSIEGRVGLMIISDWKTPSSEIYSAITTLCDQYSKRLEIYGIVTGSSEKIIEKFKSDEKLNNYIQFHSAEKLMSYDNLKQFVKSTFLEPIKDADGDGISNIEDICINTPPGAWVDTSGCPKDSDRDGIYDGLDRCQKTPDGLSVNEHGCFQLPVLFFQNNQFHLSRAQEKSLETLIGLLRKKQICLEIQGYADSSGTKEENFKVSQKRAQSVLEFFLSEGLRHYQMRIKAFGSSVPISKQQMSIKNVSQRRVEFKEVPCKKRR